MNVIFYSNDIIMNISMLISFVLFSFLSFLFITYLISIFKHTDKYLLYAPKKLPDISIIIPAFNEEKNIIECLNSISASDYLLNKILVIVIDDGSKDGTVNLVKSFINNHNHALTIKLIQSKHLGKVEALNLGIKNSKTEIIVTLDSDTVLEKTTLRKLVTPMADKTVAATNAVASIRAPKKIIEYFQMIEFCLNNLIRTSFSQTFRNSIWFFGAVACYKRSLLKGVGYFKKDTLTEDMDLSLELYRKNFKIVTVKDAFISTKACPSLMSLFNQRMRWYYGALQSLYKNKKLLYVKNPSMPILFLFFNQYWWTFFSFVFFPLTAYQIYYWLPSSSYLGIISYLLRWFSITGPIYVLYKLPVWGLNFLNIFGVSSGIITLIMSIIAILKFKGKIHFKTLVCIFLYFPYTIVQDAIIISCVIKYLFSKKKYFIG